MVYDVRICKQCGTGFERTARAPQVYCSAKCRRKVNNRDQTGNMAEWHKKNPHVNILRTLRHRAKNKGLYFNLTKDDVVVPEFCPILGIKLESQVGKGHGGRYNSPSVDRIDNSKGYIKGNIQVVSQLANAMKSEATPEQLLKFAAWVFETYEGGDYNG